jgi:hypothetical protein
MSESHVAISPKYFKEIFELVFFKGLNYLPNNVIKGQYDKLIGAIK